MSHIQFPLFFNRYVPSLDLLDLICLLQSTLQRVSICSIQQNIMYRLKYTVNMSLESSRWIKWNLVEIPHSESVCMCVGVCLQGE